MSWRYFFVHSFSILADRHNGNNHVPTSVLSSTTLHTNPSTAIVSSSSSSSSILKNDHPDEYPQRDLNLNLHHHTHLAQQRLSFDQNDDDDDDDDDDMDETNNQNVNRTNESSNR